MGIHEAILMALTRRKTSDVTIFYRVANYMGPSRPPYGEFHLHMLTLEKAGKVVITRSSQYNKSANWLYSLP